MAVSDIMIHRIERTKLVINQARSTYNKGFVDQIVPCLSSYVTYKTTSNISVKIQLGSISADNQLIIDSSAFYVSHTYSYTWKPFSGQAVLPLKSLAPQIVEQYIYQCRNNVMPQSFQYAARIPLALMTINDEPTIIISLANTHAIIESSFHNAGSVVCPSYQSDRLLATSAAPTNLYKFDGSPLTTNGYNQRRGYNFLEESNRVPICKLNRPDYNPNCYCLLFLNEQGCFTPYYIKHYVINRKTTNNLSLHNNLYAMDNGASLYPFESLTGSVDEVVTFNFSLLDEGNTNELTYIYKSPIVFLCSQNDVMQVIQNGTSETSYSHEKTNLRQISTVGKSFAGGFFDYSFILPKNLI